jgi:hypothetical protein
MLKQFELRLRFISTILGLTIVGTLVIFTVSDTARVKAAERSEQVIFSGTGTLDSTGAPFGFWIWCEAESDNPYLGECKGAMYLYAQGLTKHVEDAEEPGITEGPDGIYTMDVVSGDGSIAATLTNTEEAVRGPHNTVTVTFTSPDVGTGTSTNAVVNVTGPED